MPQSKFKTITYTRKAIVLSFLSQFFPTVAGGPRDISKIYGEGPQKHSGILYIDTAYV